MAFLPVRPRADLRFSGHARRPPHPRRGPVSGRLLLQRPLLPAPPDRGDRHAGRLVELSAKEGDLVEKDQIVARIQFDDYEVEVERANAGLVAANAKLAQSKSATRTAIARVKEAKAAVAAARLTSKRLLAEVKAQRELESQARENLDRLEREVERNRKLHDEKLINAAEWDLIQTEARTGKMLLLSAEDTPFQTMEERSPRETASRRVRQAINGVVQSTKGTVSVCSETM